MKNLFKSVLKYFDINSDIKKRREVKEDTRTMLQRKLVDFRQRARQYKESGDPYMCGLNQGRAEIVEAMLDTIYSND